MSAESTLTFLAARATHRSPQSGRRLSTLSASSVIVCWSSCPDSWRASDVVAGPGTRYGFSIEGGEARPDPRSPSQPDGVLGLSQVVDHSRHSWTDSSWRGLSLPGLVIYELHVGTFSPEGTFDSVIQRLPHLVDLGVDAIELMPVAEFSGNRGWGYDGVDFFAPHHAYGGPSGLNRLVDACPS